MKRIFLLTPLLLLSFLTAKAQGVLPQSPPQVTAAVADEALSEGNWMVGGNIGNIGYNADIEAFRLRVDPTAAYFVADNFAIGARGLVATLISNGPSDISYGLAPMARYYFGGGNSSANSWFAGASLGFAGSSDDNLPDDEAFSFLFGVEAGLAHFVAQNVALEGTVSFTDTEANVFNSGFSIGLGFQIYLPGGGDLSNVNKPY